jgi:hypothetical protein
MAKYIFLPVPTQEMLKFAENWREGQIANGKTPNPILHNYESGWRKGFMRGVGLGVLRNVVATDTVYVLAHGAAKGSRKIGASRGGEKNLVRGVEEWTGGELKGYTPEALASVIQKEGLLSSFVDLRVFACGSGLIPDGESRAYAEGLCEALAALGYALIQVTGYAGSVRSSYANRRDGATGITKGEHRGVEIDGAIYKSSEFKVVFRPPAGRVVDEDVFA